MEQQGSNQPPKDATLTLPLDEAEPTTLPLPYDEGESAGRAADPATPASPQNQGEQAPAPDQTATETITKESHYPKLEGFDTSDPTAAENLEKMKRLYDAVVKQLSGEKSGGEHLLSPELVKQLVEKVQYNPKMYQGNEEDPISCVDFNGGERTIQVSAKFFEATDAGQLYNFAHEIGHQIIHQGLLYANDSGTNAFETYLKAANNPEAAKAIDPDKYPDLAYAMKILATPTLAKGESVYVQQMMANISDEAKMRAAFEKTKTTYGKTEETFRTKFMPHMRRQLAEEIINERLSCFLASDGSFESYQRMAETRMTENDGPDSDARADFFKALIEQKGEDIAEVDAYKAARITLRTNAGDTESKRIVDEFEEKNKNLLSEWQASHKACFDRFKGLKDAKINEEEDMSFGMGMPYYEGGGASGGSGQGLGIWDWVWGEWVGKPIQI